MKTHLLIHRLFVLLMTSSLPLGVFAAGEEECDPPLEYAYQNTLEIFMGPSLSTGNYGHLMDNGLGCFGYGVDDGANFQLRYTRFFGRRWGGFVQFSISPLYGNESELVESIKEDSQLQGDEWKTDDPFRLAYYGGGCTYAQAIVGATYRYDFARHWSLRPRIGIGYRSMNTSCGYEILYREVAPMVDECYEYHFNIMNRHGNELDQNRARRFAYNTSLQLQFTIRRHFFFSAEMGCSGTIGSLYQGTCREHYYIYRNCYDENRVFEHTEDVRVNRVRQMGTFFDFSFGVGWNIGFNRNERRSPKTCLDY